MELGGVRGSWEGPVQRDHGRWGHSWTSLEMQEALGRMGTEGPLEVPRFFCLRGASLGQRGRWEGKGGRGGGKGLWKSAALSFVVPQHGGTGRSQPLPTTLLCHPHSLPGSVGTTTRQWWLGAGGGCHEGSHQQNHQQAKAWHEVQGSAMSRGSCPAKGTRLPQEQTGAVPAPRDASPIGTWGWGGTAAPSLSHGAREGLEPGQGLASPHVPLGTAPSPAVRGFSSPLPWAGRTPTRCPQPL